MDPLQELFRDVSMKIASIEWNFNTITGWGIFFFIIGFNFLSGLFFRVLDYLWLLKRAANPVNEPPSTTLRKYFAPMLTRDPNETYRPFLPYIGPSMAAWIACFIGAFVIIVIERTAVTLLVCTVLAVILAGCAMMARWQARKSRW